MQTDTTQNKAEKCVWNKSACCPMYMFFINLMSRQVLDLGASSCLLSFWQLPMLSKLVEEGSVELLLFYQKFTDYIYLHNDQL